MLREFKGAVSLVSGGAGFIGSWLSEALVKEGSFVRILDNFQSGTVNNLLPILDSVEVIEGDIRDYHIVKEAVIGVDFIFHLAANASVPFSMKDPVYDFDSNAKGTFNILKASHEKANKPVILYASSAAVYGEPKYEPIDEKHPLNPSSFYGASKLAGEAYCKAFQSIHATNVVILRLFNIYGPRQPRYVMYDLLKKLSQTPEKLEVLGTGEQKRDFMYISDCVNTIISAALTPKAQGHVINIGTGTSTTVKQLSEMMLETLGLNGKTQVTYTGESWKGDILSLVADVSESRKLLEYSPRISLKEGLSLVIKWFDETLNDKNQFSAKSKLLVDSKMQVGAKGRHVDS